MDFEQQEAVQRGARELWPASGYPKAAALVMRGRKGAPCSMQCTVTEQALQATITVQEAQGD